MNAPMNFGSSWPSPSIVQTMGALARRTASTIARLLPEGRSSGTTPTGLYYEVSGVGDPVVLIHAFSVDRRMWAPQIAALERHFRVIRYDLRGHGNSAAPSEPYAPHEDLRSVLDTVSAGRATLVGLSAGSTLAIDFAIAYPDRVRRLVLASPGLNGHVPSPPLTWTQPVFQAASRGDTEDAARLWAATPIMAVHGGTAAADAVRSLVMSNQRLWSFRTNPARPLAPPAISRLAEIKSPTLVLLGVAIFRTSRRSRTCWPAASSAQNS